MPAGNLRGLKMIKKITIMSLALLSVGAAQAMTNREVSVKNIKDIEPYAAKLSKDYGKSSVCIVYDIDNTLLTNKEKFASEGWVYWQASKSNPYAKHLLSDQSANIYDFLNAVRYFINYQPVESDTVAVVSKLQKEYPSIALTSRGFSAEATTLRQLRVNGLDFTKNPIGSDQFDPSFFAQNKYKNDYTMYNHGIQYAAGGDKGELLLGLIEKERQKTNNSNLCQSVVNVDDTGSKVDMVKDELKGKLNYYAIHYTYLPDPEDSKNWEIADWSKMSNYLQQIVNRLNA